MPEVIVISDSSSSDGGEDEGEEEQQQQQQQHPHPPLAPPPPPAPLPPPAKRARAATTKEERARLAQERAAARQEATRLKAAEKDRKRDAKFAERLAAGRLQTREMVVLLCGGGGGGGGGNGNTTTPTTTAITTALEALDRSTYGIRYARLTTSISTTISLLLARTGASLAVRFARRPLTADTAGAVPASSSLELAPAELGSWANEQPDDRRRHVPYLLLVFERPDAFLAHLRRDGGRALVAEAARACPRCSLAVTVVVRGQPPLLFPPANTTTTSHDPHHPVNWSEDQRRWRELQLLCPALVQLRAVSSASDVAAQTVAAAKALARQPYERLLAVRLPSGGEDEEDEEYDYDDDQDDDNDDENAATQQGEEAPVVEGGRTQAFRACRAVAALGGQVQRSTASALNCVRGVSGARAAAVVERFPSLGQLLAAYGVGGQEEEEENGGGGRQTTAPPPRSRYALTCGLRSINAPEAQAVGDSLARKLHRVLTCEDPDELVE
jgi:hypothetical protein